jgi:hypothetical protein
MQTFLPYKDFQRSAKALDNKRLNKQVLEGYQILKVLNSDDPNAAWRNHPAVKMWRGSETSLYKYIITMAEVATLRGIKTDKNLENIENLRNATKDRWGTKKPFWIKDEAIVDRLTESHRANLYRKDPEFYFEFKDNQANPCCDRCQYFWVTHNQ